MCIRDSGTTIDELINLQTREVSMRLLSDHEIYKLEMERIFAKTWLLLGHETEVPNCLLYTSSTSWRSCTGCMAAIIT